MYTRTFLVVSVALFWSSLSFCMATRPVAPTPPEQSMAPMLPGQSVTPTLPGQSVTPTLPRQSVMSPPPRQALMSPPPRPRVLTSLGQITSEYPFYLVQALQELAGTIAARGLRAPLDVRELERTIINEYRRSSIVEERSKSEGLIDLGGWHEY